MQLINDDISEVLDSCDYTRFDNQLMKLQLGNDILQQNMSNMQKNLDRQMDILSDLQRKVNSLPQQIESMQDKLLQNNRINMEDLKDYIRKEIQMQTTTVPPVDDKIILITDMKEMLHKHDQILNEIKRNQDDSQTFLKVSSLEKHTQSLTKTISDKLAIVPQMDVKLSKIESSTMISRNILARYRRYKQPREYKKSSERNQF
ncbi:hypothetical protein DOY81_012399 [Sarcophaga bullata]|nr:hypothetical protein DOY81_012399 [Sarcophaga bullata]